MILTLQFVNRKNINSFKHFFHLDLPCLKEIFYIRGLNHNLCKLATTEGH